MKNRRFGLIGFPLGHSFSKTYFSQKFEKEGISDASYELYPLQDIRDFPALLLNNPSLVGLNVTVPYKEKIIPYLDSLDDKAQRIGAVNVVSIHKGGYLTGSNSDYDGFCQSLLQIKPAGFWAHKNALVFGTGGSSKAVQVALMDLGMSVQLVSRHKTEQTLSYDQVVPGLVESQTLFVHCTPVGMYPHSDECIPFPFKCLTSRHVVVDLVYNPPETLFLKKAAEMGATTLNGLPMLLAQAEKAWQIWNAPSDER